MGCLPAQGPARAADKLRDHQKIQDRLAGKAKAPQRKNLAADFPLRGFVACGDCGGSLTSCWSKGRISYHAYYLCHNRECESYGKSIRREKMEGEFDELLQGMQPRKNSSMPPARCSRSCGAIRPRR